MTSAFEAAGEQPAAVSTCSGRPLTLDGWGTGPQAGPSERDALLARARETDSGRQLQRCFPRWSMALEHLSWRALRALAADQPVDPSDPDAWRTRDEAALGVLRRHGLTRTNPGHLTITAVDALIAGQAAADRAAGLDWTTVTAPASRLDEALRRAHARLPIDLSDPGVFAHVGAQRRALAARLGLAAGQADDLSRWALACPGQFDASDLRCWRIASASWLALADEQLDPVDRVERPVGLFVVPAAHRRRLAALPRALARRHPADRRARRPARTRPARRHDPRRPSARARRARQRAHAARRTEGAARQRRPARPRALARARADRLARRAARQARPLGTPARPAPHATSTPAAPNRSSSACGSSRSPPAASPSAGSAPARRDDRHAQRSAVMELGEAIQTAVDARAAAAAVHRGGRTAQGHRADRADEGTPRHADHHHQRRAVGVDPAPGRRAGDQPAARAQERRGERDAGRRRPPGGADDARAAARRRPRAARPPAADRRAQGRRLRRRRLAGRFRQDRFDRPRARPPGRHDAAATSDGGGRGPAAVAVARRAATRRPGTRAAAAGPEPGRARARRPPVGGRAGPRVRPRAGRPAGRDAGRQQPARPPPRRARGHPLAPAGRRRGAALRQPRHRGPPGAAARAHEQRRPTAGC